MHKIGNIMSNFAKDLFSHVEDPRVDRTKKHPLESILFLVLCGSLSGIDSWSGYEDFGNAHHETLSRFIDFPHGIPSHDTISRVISSLDVDQFHQSFFEFTSALKYNSGGVISIDGKTARGSHSYKDKRSASHIVSAWSEQDRLCLGQVKTSEKSNEITAIPELLDMLDIWNHIVTIDAMGCQRDICRKIKLKEGDYVISLKGNQGNLHQDIKDYFEDTSLPIDHEWEEWDKGHGRIEHRKCCVLEDIDWLQDQHQWPGLRSVAVVYSSREFVNSDKKSASETRYYITSLPANAETIAKAARKHWAVENSLHWVLDMSFNEDGSRIRNDNAPEIMSLIRKWALNIINQNKGSTSVKRMMKQISMEPKKLINIINKI